MDQDSEMVKVRWILGLGAIFLITGFLSFNELRYLAWGRVADAQVTGTHTATSRRSSPQLVVEYNFAEAGGERRSESDRLPGESTVSEGSKLPVQYIPGSEGSSRIQGNSTLVPVWIFLASLVAIGIFLFKLAREANEPIRGKRKPSNSR